MIARPLAIAEPAPVSGPRAVVVLDGGTVLAALGDLAASFRVLDVSEGGVQIRCTSYHVTEDTYAAKGTLERAGYVAFPAGGGRLFVSERQAPTQPEPWTLCWDEDDEIVPCGDCLRVVCRCDRDSICEEVIA